MNEKKKKYESLWLSFEENEEQEEQKINTLVSRSLFLFFSASFFTTDEKEKKRDRDGRPAHVTTSRFFSSRFSDDVWRFVSCVLFS